jgi:type 1 glutamine amidotransferase
MRRRDLWKPFLGAGLGLGGASLAWPRAPEAAKRKVLYFTRSTKFEHGPVKRVGADLSVSEKALTEMGRRSGFEVECTKDGRVFDGDLNQYDAIAFYTQGDLTAPADDGSPAMTPAGKQKLLDAIARGKGFLGFHSATDTLHSQGPREENQAVVDPYIAMLGGEFIWHAGQQKVALRLTKSGFLKHIKIPAEGVAFMDEWYAFKNFAKDLHVIGVQQCQLMKGDAYDRPDYPAMWARRHGRGRVFYISNGHREDIWTNPLFQEITLAALAWVTNQFDFDATPNIQEVTPHASQLEN